MRVYSMDVIDFFKRNENTCYIIAIIAIILRLYFYSSNTLISSFFVHVYMIFGVVSIFNLANRLLCVKDSKVCKVLSDSTLFIYCSHLVFKPFVVLLASKLLIYSGDIVAGFKYILVAFVMIFFSFSLYVIMKKLCPRTLALFNGGR